MSRTKIDKIKQRMETSTSSQISDSRSTKVQMILERHRKLKSNKDDYNTCISKIHNMSSMSRRSKNNSNISLGPPNSTFLNFTIESGAKKMKNEYTTDEKTESAYSNNETLNGQKTFISNARYNTIGNHYIEEN